MKRTMLTMTIIGMTMIMGACGSEDDKYTTKAESKTGQTVKGTTEVENESTKDTEAKYDTEITVEDVMNAEPNPASDFEYGSGADENSIMIVEYLGDNPIVVIPNEIDGKPVIAVDGLYNNKIVKAVKLSDNVKTVIFKAFKSAENLEIFIAGSGLEVIESYAFMFCKSLNTVILNEGLKELGDSAFLGAGFKEIKVPSTIEKLGLSGPIEAKVIKYVKRDSVAAQLLIEKEYDNVVFED